MQAKNLAPKDLRPLPVLPFRPWNTRRVPSIAGMQLRLKGRTGKGRGAEPSFKQTKRAYQSRLHLSVHGRCITVVGVPSGGSGRSSFPSTATPNLLFWLRQKSQ